MCFPIQDRTLPVLSWGNRPLKSPTKGRKPDLVSVPEQLIGRVWSGVKILLLSVNFVFRSYMVLDGSPENQFSEFIL